MKAGLNKTFSALVLLVVCLLLSTILIVDLKNTTSLPLSRYLWFFSLLSIAGGIAFILSFFKKFTIPLNNNTNILMLFALISITLIYLFTDKSESLRIGIVLMVIVSYFYFQLFLQLNKHFFTGFQFVLIGIALIEVIWGYFQHYAFLPSLHDNFFITGSLQNPGPYSIFLSIVSPIALYWTIQLTKNLDRLLHRSNPYCRNFEPTTETINTILLLLLSGITLFGIVSILPLTMSRTAWFATLISSLFVIFRFFSLHKIFKKALRTHRKTSIALLVGCSLLAVLFCGSLYHIKKDSADGRMLIWKISSSIIKEHPFFGVGLSNFQVRYGEAQEKYFAGHPRSEREKMLSGTPEYGFNEYLQITVETGLVGLLFFITLILLTLWKVLIKLRQNISYCGIAGAFITFIIVCFFSYPLNVLPIGVVFALLLALCNHSKHETRTKVIPTPVILYTFLGLIIFGIIYPRMDQFRNYRKWSLAKNYYNMNIYADAADLYAPLYGHLKEHPQFLFEYGHALSLSGKNKTSNQLLLEAAEKMSDPMIYNVIGKNYQTLQRYDLAETYYMKAYHLVPHRIYPLYLLANLYNEMGLVHQSLYYARELIDKEPKVYSIAVKEMTYEMEILIKDLTNVSCRDNGVLH